MREGWSYEYEVAGRRLYAERAMVTIERLENAIGPIWPFAERLEKGQVTYVELSRFYSALMRANPDGIDACKELDGWLFSEGVFAHKGIAWFAASLVAGDVAFEREMKRLGQSADGL